MKNYDWDELVDKSIKELNDIKEELVNEKTKYDSKKNLLAQNIIILQDGLRRMKYKYGKVKN